MIYDCIVIGAGPAGIAASSYLVRKGLKALLISKDMGGQVLLTPHIFSNPAAPDITTPKLIKRYELAIKDVPFRKEEVLDVKKYRNNFLIKTKKNNYLGKTVVIASGRKPKQIKLPFDNSVKNKEKYDFEDYPYPKLKNNKILFIVGGGYVSLDIAEILHKFCEKIYIMEPTDTLGGNLVRQKKVKSFKNVKIFLETNLIDISEKNKIKYAKIKTKKDLKDIPFDNLFIAVGTVPNTEFINNIKKNKIKEIIIKKAKDRATENMSSIPGIFAAGDVTDDPVKGFELTSLGQGIETAMAVYTYLRKKEKKVIKF